MLHRLIDDKGTKLALREYLASAGERITVSRSPDEIRVGITLVFFLCYTVAMRDFLCKVYDKLYCFLGYADMRLIPGYESGGKGCARISFYIRGLRPLFS